MSRLLFVLGLLSLGSGLGAVYVARPSIPDALFCEYPVLDLGELNQNQVASGSFTVINGTQKPFILLGITETCQCSVAQVSTSELKPGGRSEITVKWATGSRRGKAEVMLVLDCAFGEGMLLEWRRATPLALVLKGHIIPEYDVEPLEPSFEVGACEKRVVRFSPRRMEEVRVTNVLCSHHCLSAKILEDKQSIEITVHPENWRKVAGFTPWVTVTTNSERAPTTELWCTIN